MARVIALAFTALLAAGSASAQTIYPLNRADILTGAKFDFKVEFPGAPAEAETRITIAGQTPAAYFGKDGTFIRNEDGLDHSAFVIRDVAIKAPGAVTVEASAGAASAKVTWGVYATPAPRRARNVILFIGDGLTIAHRTAARILSKGIAEGKYFGDLAIDDMPAMALISTAGSDSIVTDSANSMSAYTTGHKSCVNALGVYCARNKNTLEHPKVETIAELAKRRLGLAVGVVTNTEIEDATPAGMVAHTRRRADYNDIVEMFYKVQPDVIMGGGSINFLPKSTPGSRRSATHSPPRCQEAEGGGGGGSATTASTKGTLELERRTFEGRDAVDVTLAWYGRGMGGGESVETLGGRARWEGSGRRYKVQGTRIWSIPLPSCRPNGPLIVRYFVNKRPPRPEPGTVARLPAHLPARSPAVRTKLPLVDNT